jgi:drug/metabolite transporter (DMT)-like permease
MTTADRRAPLVLAIAVLGISLAAPLIRLSTAAPLAIAAWRLAFSLVIIGIALAVTGSWRQWSRLSARELGVALAAGVALAIHFWSFNVSLGYTSVAASVLLVNIQPVLVAALSGRWLGEAPSTRQWGGVGLALVGALIVGLSDASGGAGGATLSSRALFGDGLALLGAAAAALYYLAGRRLRQKLDLWPYVGLVYGACFVTLLLFAAGARVPLTPQPARELAIFAALAAGPMLLGHTGMNWALKHLPAYVVNLTTLGEPVGATLLAMVLPWIHEVPGVLTLVGGAVVLVGVLITARRE